jgi:uncharacterized protein HemY
MSQSVGLILIASGVALAIVGGLAYAGLLGWLGQLPGDIHIESGKTRVYIPITTMLIVSLALSVIVHLLRKLFG